MSDSWLHFEYRDFYDVPRAIVVESQGTLFLLDCSFDMTIDEYPDIYSVYSLPIQIRDRLKEMDWTGLHEIGTYITSVPVIKVKLDPTRRRAIAAELFDGIRQSAP